MFTKRVDRRWRSAPRWCVVALALSGAAVAFAQIGGKIATPGANLAGNPAEAPSSEQRLFPQGLPKIEAMLKAALEHHPDVLAARNKLRAAEAEQRQAELKALKDVMDVRDRWEKASKTADAANLGANHPAMREHLGNLAAIEWELAFLLGTRGELPLGADVGGEARRSAAQDAAKISTAPVVVDSAIPRGEQAKAFKNKLGEEITLSMEDMPLTDVVVFLSEQSDLRFILDKQTLEGDGIPADLPITLNLGDVELGTALQALEDLHKPLYFVVRDYGILVTTESNRSPNSVSARDFWKLTEEELRQKLQQQRQDGGGGFGGGGGMGGGGGGFF